MQISQAGIDLIKSFESLRLEAYLCPAGVWTIGWGHTAGVLPGDRTDEAGAEEFLQSDIATVEAALPKVIRVPLSQGQWDALTSLGFNLAGGPAAFPHVAPKMTAFLNAGNFAAAADEMLDIDRDIKGHVLPGLARRRQAERALFLSA